MQYKFTTSQLAIYYESVNKSGLPVYIIPIVYQLAADVDLERLRSAVDKAVDTFPVLNMVGAMDAEGMPCLAPDTQSGKFHCQIKKMSVEEFDELLTTLPKPMDLDGGRLFDIRIYETPAKSYLYMAIHHVISDGATFGILKNVITRIYRGEDVSSEETTIFDVQAKEERNLNSPRHEEAQQWYLSAYGGIETSSLPLPDILEETSIPAKDMLSNLHRVSKKLNADYDQAFAFSRHVGVPLSILLDGAFGYMAGVWNGADESFFCTVFSGRMTEEEKGVVGMMVKTLPMYCRWSDDTPVAEYLKELAQQHETAKGYSDTVSFAEICSSTGITPSLNFSYRGSVRPENYHGSELFDGSRVLGYHTTGDSLQFVLDHSDNGLVLTVEYQADRYTREFIDSMIDTYDTVLQGMFSRERLADIEFCSPEMCKSLDALNKTSVTETPTETIVDVFERHIKATPDKILVHTDDVRLTYSQTGDMSSRIASYINRLGITRGDVVAVMADRNSWMMPATMGVLCSGAAFQPLDASYPAERLNYMMRDAKVRLLIAERDLMIDVDDDLRQAMRILYTDEIPALEAGDKPLTQPTPEDTFVLLYTSGTTGVPKGVKLTHANLMSLADAHRHEIEGSATTGSIWSMYASYGFDAGYFCLLLPVIYGASVAIVPEELRLDMEALNAFFMRHGVNFAFMTTQVGRIFATTIEETSVKTLGVGGEKLVPCAPPANFRLFNLYGPTEGTVYSHALRVDKLYSRVPLGHTTEDYKNYIVDKHNRRMPLGAHGEMLIAGPQVGPGYLNLPEKTASVFIDNPFCDEPLYSHAYRTGDVVRLLPANGQADIIGRNDSQVKIRGFRIELTEVEKVIREFPGIKDATVQAFDRPTGGKYIAAYVVADVTIDTEALNGFIAERKPAYMVPEATMQIDAIPLNRNQKVDKRALPIPSPSSVEEAAAVDRKPNILEQAICEIVAQVLNIDRVPLAVAFNRLGLTSITSIRLTSMLFKRFGVRMKASELVNGATVMDVENAVLQELLSEGKPCDIHKDRGEKRMTMPLTVSQQGVYADVMREPNKINYNIPLCLKFPATADARAIASAMERILDAHPYLRDAHLQIGDKDIEQTMATPHKGEVNVIALAESQLQEHMREFIQPFDLMKAPLYRIEVVSTSEAVYLLIDVHHLVFDGSSLNILTTQLKTLLEGGEVADEKYTYLDYATVEKEWLEGDGGLKAAESFQAMLADCEAASEVPSDLKGGQETGECEIVTHPIDMAAANSFCRQHGLTPAALYLAATCYATARFTTSKAAYISTISTGRNDVRFSDTMGMCVKTLPVAMKIGEGNTLDFAHEAKGVLDRAIENEMYPYGRICSDYNYAPNIVYAYQYGLVDRLMINGELIENETVDALKFKLSVQIEEVDGVPCVAVHYDRGLYSKALMQTFADSIATAATEFMRNPHMEVRKISMLSEAQRRLLDKYAYTELTEPSPKCFHELMEEQAELYPDRTAIIACDRNLTYSQLDSMANVVANNLIAKGVKPGDKVAIFISRTSRIFTTLYGVLKAGAAFIPSSPDYPEERKREIVENSQAAFTVTNDNVESLHTGASDRKPEVKVSPEDLAYLIYTSGSTGKPKGVLLRHKGIVNYVSPYETMTHVHAIKKHCKVVGSITTFAFDMGLQEWGFGLSNGLTTVFPGDSQFNDPLALAELFDKHHVDFIDSTPMRLLQYTLLDEFSDMLSRCKLLSCGGEKYPEKLLDKLRKVTPDAILINYYGPTEITVASNACDIAHKDWISVGRPLRNYVEYIVDADDNLLPPGAIGELLIGGWVIGAGYNNNPEQTAKAFINFMGVPTYRSGDYARWDEEGGVVILGRKDTQVKLRGLRIELGEIDRVMADIDGIDASHIMIRKVACLENLVAYYTLKAGVGLSVEDIKRQMAAKLTDYMVPSFFVELATMPLTTNGKINTRELPEPVLAVRETGIAAANGTEQFFIDLFKEVLGTDTVYADDSFFALGGTSLLATRIMIAAAKAGYHLIYADIFANPTPQALAAKLSDANVGQGEEQVTLMSNVEHDGYDYSRIDKLLAGNTLDAFRTGEGRSLGAVLLTGATGFAGIHVLNALLSEYDMPIVCLVRDGRDGVSAEERLAQLFFYYFGESLSDRFPGRVRVVKSDITQINAAFDPGCGIDTVINCAANVKHFSAGTDIEDINYYGVLNLIEWCKAHGAALVQASTISVTGSQPIDSDNVLSEQSLYIRQSFSDNKYIISKFLAERAVLEATARGEIVGKVVRLGNLAPRERDGEFQINFRTNSFMNRLKSTALLGCYPYFMYDSSMDISPIDEVARAIVLFAQTPETCVLFHGNNANRYRLGNFYHEAALSGLHIRPVEDEEYAASLEAAKNDPEKMGALVGLMAYEGMGAGLKPVDYTNQYSNQVLLRMGFHWPVVSSGYVEKLISAISELGFFIFS